MRIPRLACPFFPPSIARRSSLVLFFFFSVATWAWFGAEGLSASPAESLARLTARYPEVRVASMGTCRKVFYGTSMSEGGSPESVAESWLSEYGEAFGVRQPAFEPTDSCRAAGNDLQVFTYRQRIEGLEVEHGMVRIVVLEGSPCRVVYAAANLVPDVPQGLPSEWISEEAALEACSLENPSLTRWMNPEPVVFAGEGVDLTTDPRGAWKVRGASAGNQAPASFCFFVDGSDGKILHVRNEIYSLEILGQIHGRVTPGTAPDLVGNVPVPVPLADLRVAVPGGTSTFTDRQGRYVLPNGGTAPLAVQVDLVGRWVEVRSGVGGDLLANQVITPPGPADFSLNEVPSEFSTAQVNAYHHVTAAHNFFADRLGGFSAIDVPIRCAVNEGGVCNAFFNPFDRSLGFLRQGGGCVNSAYSTVVFHEYGHFVVDRLGLAQGAFGEGFGDALAMLAFETPTVGEGFAGPGSFVRTPVLDQVQYPCDNPSIHFCGQILGGVWFRILENLRATSGSATGAELARNLFVNWSLITSGGVGNNSAHPGTAIEVLTVDDDNGNLSDGTPHFSEICAAFSSHGISCPERAPLLLTQGSLVPGQTTRFEVSGAQPGRRVFFLASQTREGSEVVCPPGFGGLCLDLFSPVHLAGRAEADGMGRAFIDVRIPRRAPELSVFTQAISRGFGGGFSIKSNVVSALPVR